MLPSVFVLVGPTASGKTVLSLQLARLIDGEILSADSRQVYRYMDIGTAKPAREEREAVIHHFIDVFSPDEEFNAGDFGNRGREVIGQVIQRGKVPLVVGGSGLYVTSLVDGFFEGPGADWEFRESLEHRVRDGRIADLIEDLRRVDPDSAARADPTKPRRIIRALEVYHLTGIPLSQHHERGKVEIRFRSFRVGLLWPRDILYRRIDARCDRMVADGLVDEAADLQRRGYGPALNALNTVGYREAFAFLRGAIDRGEMVTLFKRNSRRYAKRQMTWFRRDPRIDWVAMDEDRPLADVVQSLAQRFRAYESSRSC
jgi:tRNA dimethylallyltransferase